MIYWVQTLTFRNSPGGELRREVMALLKKLVKFDNQKWPEIEQELLTNIDGSQSAVHSKMKFESVDAAREWARKWYQDEEAMSLVKELQEIARRSGGSAFTEDIQDHYYNIKNIE